MKRILKYLLVSIIFCLTISCEDDIDNTIPENATKLSEVQENFKKIVLENTFKNNGKIWVTGPMKLKRGLTNFITFKKDYNPSVVLGFDFDNESAKIYAPFWHIQLVQTKSDESQILFDNVTNYRIGGELRTELTFLGKGVLSNLKKEGIFDFDYRIRSFSNEEIKLSTYYTQALNTEATLYPYSYDAYKLFAEAAGIFYRTTDNFFSTVLSEWFVATITIKDKQTQNVVSTYVDNRFWAFTSQVELSQTYDKDRKMVSFSLNDLPDETLAEVKGLSENELISFHNFYYRDIKYLVPTKVTDTQMIFDSYEKYDENNTSGDSKYEIIIDKIF